MSRLRKQLSPAEPLKLLPPVGLALAGEVRPSAPVFFGEDFSVLVRIQRRRNRRFKLAPRKLANVVRPLC